MSEVIEPVIEDVELDRVLDEMADDFADVEAGGVKWMPPVGRYTATVCKTSSGHFTSKKSGKEVPYAAVQVQIAEGAYEKKEFQLGFYALEHPVAKSIAKGLANLFAQRDTTSWKDVIAVIDGSEGCTVNVDVYETESKGIKYTNTRVIGLVE